MTGWVKIHRSLTEHELWNAEPFTWGQAWLDLIINTNHAEGSFTVRRQVVKLERGQIGWSELTMTERWKWSRGKVRRFLKKLKNEHMIKQETGHLTSVITICNYNEFQGDPKVDGTTDDTTNSTAGGTSDEHQAVHQAVHKQECKELKNENNGKKKQASPVVDFSVFDVSDDQISEIKRIRRKNKGGSLTPRVVNALAKEFQEAQAMGYTFDELLTEWEFRGWKSFKAEWIKPKAMNGMSQKDQQRQQMIEDRNRELGIGPQLQNDFIDGEVLRHD